MFITRNRLEEIKSHERWEHERRLNREREMSDMWQRIRKLEYKVAMLEREIGKKPDHVNPETVTHAENVPITYTDSPF